jgi:hypothetical protein
MHKSDLGYSGRLHAFTKGLNLAVFGNKIGTFSRLPDKSLHRLLIRSDLFERIRIVEEIIQTRHGADQTIDLAVPLNLLRYHLIAK